jgi:hypothetical protein
MIFSRKGAKVSQRRKENSNAFSISSLCLCVKPSGKQFFQISYLANMIDIMLDQAVQ